MMTRINRVPNHNWQDIGEKEGVKHFICKDCDANLEVGSDKTIYTPGREDCE